ncbi:hypothetical protein [Sphaerisporangium sp. NPDC051011]|uniref:hypothetical protein n=1 Tax=Sphaerisporangium sp. NPDC051011 TaxID=3155792 RepID=UPI0033C870E2
MSLTQAAMIVDLPMNNTLPGRNRIGPGKTGTFTLTRPSVATPSWAIPAKPRVGFVLPRPQPASPGTPATGRQALIR